MLTLLLETFLLGLKNLRLHKLRSLLTVFGIIVGVLAVIIMVAIGEGAKKEAMEQLKQLGARNILVRSVRPPESTEASGRQQRTLEYGLKYADFERLLMIPGLDAVVPLRDTEQKIIRNATRLPAAAAVGTTPAAFDVINLRLSRGEYFTQHHYDLASAVCVLGANAARQLFPFDDPIGQTVRVGTTGGGTVVLTVIGVLEPTGLRAGAGGGMVTRDLDMDLYFPLSLARQVFGSVNVKVQAGAMERKQIDLTEVWLRAKEGTDVEDLSKVVENVVLHPPDRGGKGGDRLDAEVKAPIQILRTAERQQRTFNFILVSIAALSLVVGGIGIMNIMLATVTERTREIGIRRALGAKRYHITLQFLVETTVISLTGGLIGIAAGAGGAIALPYVVAFFSDGSAHYPTDIAEWSVIGSFLVSGLIGIAFGLYPAMKAARMSPIEALRYE